MIGVFDSGIGGLTVVKELFKKLPDAGLIYFGDTARYPYGNKSKETIERYSLENARFLISRGAKIIVVACNTASALAIDALRREINVPIFEVITPAVQKAVRVTKNKKIGVIGTRGTVRSGVYKKKILQIDPNIEVLGQPCPLFVPLVEEDWIHKPETKRIARYYLTPLKNKNVDTLILGCTHYPLLKGQIREKIGRRVILVDSAEEVASEIEKYVTEHSEAVEFNKQQVFYLSDVSEHTEKIASKWLERAVNFQAVDKSF